MARVAVFDELLTTVEVATIFNVKPLTILRWARSGRLPAVKIGRAWRFRASDITKFADRLTKSTEPAPRNLSPE